MTIHAFLLWLQETSPAAAIADSTYLFPLIETAHVMALALVAGSIATFDLRILGLAWHHRPLETLPRHILPWTWSAFAIAVLTGTLLFSSAAVRYAANPFFRFKLLLLVLAGINMLAFHVLSRGGLRGGERLPSPLRVSAAVSILTWTGVVFLGRWIAFV